MFASVSCLLAPEKYPTVTIRVGQMAVLKVVHPVGHFLHLISLLDFKDYTQDELVATVNRLKPLDADSIHALALRCLELVDYKN